MSAFTRVRGTLPCPPPPALPSPVRDHLVERLHMSEASFRVWIALMAGDRRCYNRYKHPGDEGRLGTRLNREDDEESTNV